MPRLWSATIETHRQAVRDAAVEVTAALVAQHGLRAVTMSTIAEQTGIGRATLYRYYPDVEAILRAWHDREVGRHLEQLAAASQRTAGPGDRLRAVLEEFAAIAQGSHGHRDAELAALLHRDDRLVDAERRVHLMLEGLLADAASAGVVRGDMPTSELADYCMHALAAARTARSAAAIRRLVDLTMRGLRPGS